MPQPNIKLNLSPTFLKQVKKLKKIDRKTALKLEKQLKIFINNPYDHRLKTHKLGGKLTGRFAFRVTPDIKVVFRWTERKEILLIAIGSHNKVYK